MCVLHSHTKRVMATKERKVYESKQRPKSEEERRAAADRAPIDGAEVDASISVPSNDVRKPPELGRREDHASTLFSVMTSR
ncbi:hypothetical protein RRG08_007932 [Elysia crispata]|uniref:Uncharacterized protein n=1 Tax=Elysia crispata TaxID=231223 RepID=A0AAE1DL62_9GAST|nr:hypothetical protein RRG08_007932 [Elysia crispata]